MFLKCSAEQKPQIQQQYNIHKKVEVKKFKNEQKFVKINNELLLQYTHETTNTILTTES